MKNEHLQLQETSSEEEKHPCLCVRNSTRAMTEPAYESTLSLKFIICAVVTNELILWVLRRNVLVTISGKTGECSQ